MSIEVGRYLGQDGVWLKNSNIRLFVQNFGGMTPEFAFRSKSKSGEAESGELWVNTHWNPHFRGKFSGKLDESSKEHKEYWGIELLRQAAGTFPCGPTFGPGNETLLPHGDMANSDWTLERTGTSSGSDFALWALQGGYQNLTYRKQDLIHSSHNAHYMVLDVTNPNEHPVTINLAWHTTLGAPFLERGCQIVNNCDRFTVAPEGTEFDETTSLKAGAAFTHMRSSPSKSGGLTDKSVMPGYNGHSEFITGTSEDRSCLWSACFNPYLELVYLTVIPLGQLAGQADAGFMNYWMHSGGRNVQPWADLPGSPDRNYALGMETSIGASCQGLDHSIRHPKYMDKPSNLVLKGGESVAFPCVNLIFPFSSKAIRAEKVEQQIKEEVQGQLERLDFGLTAFQA